MAGSIGRRGVARADAWPVWVDALSNLLIVVIFVLMVFVVAQAYLSTSLNGRDQALTRLNRQLAELGELLAMEREANADLRTNIGQLSVELQSSTLERDRLVTSLAEARAQRDTLEARLGALTGRADRNAGDLAQVSQQLEDAYRVIEADRGKIEMQLRQIAGLEADIRQLREVRQQLEGQVAALTTLADQNRTAREQAEQAQARTGEDLRLTREDRDRLLAELGALRDRSRSLEAQVASEAERTMLAQREVETRETRIGALEDELGASRTANEQARQQVDLLNRQIAELRNQLAAINAVLGASEARTRDQQTQIADLGRRLNVALASKVEELNRYRSEFFGRLREALGARPDIRIVGDRFVFQSEVLFNSGSAMLEDRGRDELAKLAQTLLEIAGTIPPDVNWVLRVDGHTDLRPINTPQFPSNWELSTARAIAVVNALREQGIPPERLAAAGFAEFQPLEAGNTETAFARNRRIEIKFDQR
ncbi:peptidoglycan -binding protein [Arenibaculum pallidiluteum]|uniref:peptidoglycan -binding protein n=1 Tax=Arenibaculum pallidiluteum TaxID=2812559 RepID=UPI001A95ED0A|nr:peptidoglycan -binding protein [Arenibaculum pallidiluteum]